MKILVIILCIVILLRDKKEGWGWAKKQARKAKRAAQRVARAAKRAAQAAARRIRQAAQAAARIRKKIATCTKRLIQHRQVARERAMWGKKIKDLRNQASYKDTNFGNKVMYVYYRDDMNDLNDTINENTRLNNDLNNMLNRIKIIQTNNKDLVDQLKTQNTHLKECKMNKELTDNDYDVLK